jgi:hypothetical protein
MSARINHVAVWVAAIVYFLLGWVWYTVFGAAWVAAMGKTSMNGGTSPTIYVWSFLLGLILAYATAVALARHPDNQNLQQGVSFALFMGIALFATQTLNQVLYAGTSFVLWLINTGYVVVGFAIIGAIVGGWKKTVAAAG